MRLTQFDSDRQAAAANAQIEANRVALSKWLQRHHPEIPDCIAVQKVFEEYADSSYPISDSEFEFMLGNLESRISKQRVPTTEETKAELIETILELISSTNGGRDGKYSTIRVNGEPSDIDRERTRMSYWTIPSLTERLNEVREKQRLQPKSAGQIRQELAASRPTPSKYPGFPNLDKTVTASTIKNLSTFELKKLIRLHSVQQVNARLRGEE